MSSSGLVGAKMIMIQDVHKMVTDAEDYVEGTEEKLGKWTLNSNAL